MLEPAALAAQSAMPKAFDFSSPPFDRLRPMEVERVNHVVDVVFFRTGQTPCSRAGTLPDHFYVVIKGLVEERAGDEVVAVHESGDGFDSEILVHQTARHDFVVREEAICYALPIEDFLELTANNTGLRRVLLQGHLAQAGDAGPAAGGPAGAGRA